MELRIIAIILLLGRLVALYFIISVIRRQVRLIRIVDNVGTIRKVLFGLSSAMLGMQFVPIIINVLAIAEPLYKSTIAPFGAVYAFSNMVFSIVASVMLWLMYELIDKDNIKMVDEAEQLENKRKDLVKTNDKLQHDLQDKNAVLRKQNKALRSQK